MATSRTAARWPGLQFHGSPSLQTPVPPHREPASFRPIRPKCALPPRHRSPDGLLGGRWPPSSVHPLDLTPTRLQDDLNEIQTPNQGDPLPIGKGSCFLGWVLDLGHPGVESALAKVRSGTLPDLTRLSGTRHGPIPTGHGSQECATVCARPTLQHSQYCNSAVLLSRHRSAWPDSWPCFSHSTRGSGWEPLPILS